MKIQAKRRVKQSGRAKCEHAGSVSDRGCEAGWHHTQGAPHEPAANARRERQTNAHSPSALSRKYVATTVTHDTTMARITYTASMKPYT
jgi:hypothetical protein